MASQALGARRCGVEAFTSPPPHPTAPQRCERHNCMVAAMLKSAKAVCKLTSAADQSDKSTGGGSSENRGAGQQTN
mgnify:CR=1 FL=1